MATLSATTIPALIAALHTASPGDTVSLSPGDYGTVTINDVTPPCASTATPCVTVELSKARFETLRVVNSSGLVITGPTSIDSRYYGFEVGRSSNVTLTGWRCQGGALAACVGIGDNSSDITVTEGEGYGHAGDCIDMNSVRRVTIARNTCHDNIQIPGKSPHPDVVQIWSIMRDGACVPTTDVTVENNHGMGDTQGIDTFGSLAQCPVERIVIRHNLIESAGWWCYGLFNAVDSRLEDNGCKSLPPRRSLGIDVVGGHGNVVRRNKVDGF